MSGKARIWLVAAGVLLPVVAGAPAVGAPQEVSQWQQVVLDQLERFGDSLVEGGFHPVVVNIMGSAAAGERQRISLTLDGGTGYGVGGFCDNDCSDLDLRLFDPVSTRELLSDIEPDDYPALEFTAENTAVFELEIDMVTCASEPCFFGVSVYATERPSGAYSHSAGGRLLKGDTELSAGEYYDRHPFTALAGQRIVVDMTSSQFDTYLILRDPSGETVQNDDWEGSTRHSRIEHDTAVSGTWEVLATSMKGAESGDYRLEISVSGGGGAARNAAVAGRSTTGGARSTTGGARAERGTLDAGDRTLRSGEYFDTYTFEGAPGQQLRVTLSSRDFDTYVIVAGPGEQRAENDDDDGTDSGLEMELEERGTYEVLVTSYEVGESGTYELSIELDEAGPETLARREIATLRVGDRVRGALDSGDGQLDSGEYRDVFLFDGVAGQTVVVDLSSSDFDTYVGIVPPTGDAIENDDFEGRTDLSRVEYTLPETGSYTVVATSYAAGETGSYEVTLTATAAPTAASGARRGDRGNVYGVFVGVSDYPGTDDDLAYTAADARRIAAALERGAGMGRGNGIVLTDADATAANVRRAIQDVGARVGPDDVFVFFFSGHGSRVQRSAPQSSDPDSLDETIEMYDRAIVDDEFSELLSAVPARVSLIVLDACFSGGFAKDVISAPGRMGLFSSEEDVTSQVAAKFRAGGYLAQFVADAVGEGLADADGDDALTALELSQYLHERYRVDVKAVGPAEFVRTSQVGYQHLVVDRGSVSPYDVLFR